ncbi:Substrate-binding region of ABC-type glycine betaine transport system [Methylobacterium sp. 4-46]|uniref:glycine betaine ABC transporter substrate-binding protein n=1 Tax=unclassified Methylobacterium TaxID=2615210 RepID=UPI000152CB7B|nr:MULTISPECIES: glycine betaine ABC transporter substrate-binding protein [Methylobacterium]ACA14606.1 Substrate-binding region of ABC-type glycine betaine transport system [Methylobacterium sp. 4-46]WFT80362.1 glycine betaine ABC transporter substrate-binding protein [Methylobacterium nodulans]
MKTPAKSSAARPRPGPNRRLLLLGLGGALAGGRASADGEAVTVASKGDAEGTLLGQIIAQTLRGLGIPVVARLQLGPTRIVRTAITAGEIDAYPEYTGNAAFFSGTETDPAWKSAATAIAAARRFDAPHGLVWLTPARANNSWQIAVRGDLARRERLSGMADFAGAVRRGLIELAASAEFVESPAALAAYEKAYGFVLPRERIITLPGGDTSVTLRAAAQGISGVNAGMVYGTDGAIAALDVVVMEDPLGAQIVYEPAPVFRAPVLARHPAIAPALDGIFSRLDLPTLRRLNGAITVEGGTPEAVARRYLAEG